MADADKTPKEEFQDLLEEVIEKIKVIDKKVPWSDAGEPAWWLVMMDFRRNAYNTKESLK